MNRCCSHCHARLDGILRDMGWFFWALVATVAGMWLVLAMEMLRRPRTQWERERYTDEELSAMITDENVGYRPDANGRGPD